MPTPRLVALGLLLVLESASCQEARGGLQPWLQGIIAVVVFLVLVAIAFMVNKLWCKEKEENVEAVVSIGEKHETVLSNGREGRYVTAADFRSNESEYTYENIVEPEEKVVTTAM
ncbi:PDZK1-interacting protein 1 [Nothoprocta perdicaria]|uniref:PDZK1-interacting protein 1 n=1 Tax=Nothoprocta perdicaria TaxID=30464 RepID=UPI000E1BBA78|nr:PDZK1-interacting protein 1 [Nothoprocta perdicaria]